jgi:hypothetical protein
VTIERRNIFMKENSLLIRHRMPLLLLAFFAIIVLRMPIAVFADISMNFRVTISYDVENDHDGEENKIIVYYWNPSETGYTYDDSNHATIGKVAFKEGDNRSVSVNLPGPPASMEVYFHGSLTDKVEYYVNKVEVEALNPVPGNDRAKKVTLWEGILGCSVATTFSNTISNRLYFNSPDSGSFPYFQGWRDPGTGREAVFGDDKETITSDYYKDGCRKPAAVGRVGFLTDLPDSLPIPRDNMPASYTISVKDGELYDCYGAPWPNQPSEGSLSVSPDNKHLQLKKLSEDKWTLTINPNSNEAEDYRLTLTHTKEGTEETATSTLQSFDYNYTFLDEYGAVIETRSVNYGASVDPPYSGARTVTWCCDAYSDWKKTNDGPQDRTVYRKPLLEGDGSQSTPALIKTADDWDKLQAIVQNGASKEKHFRLENNISVTETIGTSQHPFEGLFDGNGKVLTIHYSNVNNEERTAPFAYARNATISNLTVNGSIDGSADHAAGILGENDGTTLIKKCTVSAAIKGGAYVGGF